MQLVRSTWSVLPVAPYRPAFAQATTQATRRGVAGLTGWRGFMQGALATEVAVLVDEHQSEHRALRRSGAPAKGCDVACSKGASETPEASRLLSRASTIGDRDTIRAELPEAQLMRGPAIGGDAVDHRRSAWSGEREVTLSSTTCVLKVTLPFGFSH